MNTDDLRYPIGKPADQQYANQTTYAENVKEIYLRDIRLLPSLLEQTVQNLDEAQLQIPYRPGGWTIQQVVHHVADSHLNAYLRFKLALTEETPAIKPYDEAAWAELSDTRNTPINISLTLLHALHARLHELLSNMTEAEWGRTYFHPAQNKVLTLWNMLGIYAWHGKHHMAHIMSLRDRMKW